VQILRKLKMQTIFYGIDLSGPSNTKGTTLVSFKMFSDSIQIIKTIEGATDQAIYDAVIEIPTHWLNL